MIIIPQPWADILSYGVIVLAVGIMAWFIWQQPICFRTEEKEKEKGRSDKK